MSEKLRSEELQRYIPLDLLAKQVVEGFITGMHKSPFHGFSVEFAEHRLYNNGESTKHIDWKLYGRTEKLFVKRYEEETNLRCRLLIDNSASMRYPDIENPGLDRMNKLSFSVYAAAAIMLLLKKQRDAVGLSVFAKDLELSTASRSSSVHHQYLYTELDKLLQSKTSEKQKTTAAAENLHLIAESIHRRSLLIIFSDMLDNTTDSEHVFQALQHLKHNKHEVVLFHVTDKKHEVDFDFPNRPYRFVDKESGEELKLFPAEVRKAYVEKMASYRKELQERCAQYKIDLIEADINQGFHPVLMSFLVKRGRLF